MKRLHGLVLAISFAGSLVAGELDNASRKALVDHLNKSSTEFADAVKGLTAEQWKYKPASGGWSIAECAEHIVLTEDLLRGMVEKLLAGEVKPSAIADTKAQDEKVLKMITDRSGKAKAPEQLRPTGQFGTPQVAVEKYEATRMKTMDLAKTRGDLRDHASPHPMLKELDAYQWMLYTSGHSLRHTAQIEEVKTDAGYPKGKP